MTAPVVTFLSDYGLEDGFAGICHGVIARICPQARVIDVTHGVARHDVRAGALIMREALQYMPLGVHLAVVDPEVGTCRRAVALRAADGRLLVGPDNGLLSPAAQVAGGVTEAVDIDRSRFCLQPVSATFHGRDLFAPVAAHLAAGASLARAGVPCDPGQLVSLELPLARREDGALVAHALYVDRFGNVALDIVHDELIRSGLKLGHAVELALPSGESRLARYVRAFADVAGDELLVYEDSSQRLAVAINRGAAASVLGLAVDDELRINPVPGREVDDELRIKPR